MMKRARRSDVISPRKQPRPMVTARRRRSIGGAIDTRKEGINGSTAAAAVEEKPQRAKTPSSDVRRPTPSSDVRRPTPSSDVRRSTPSSDVRRPTPSSDVRRPTQRTKTPSSDERRQRESRSQRHKKVKSHRLLCLFLQKAYSLALTNALLLQLPNASKSSIGVTGNPVFKLYLTIS